MLRQHLRHMSIGIVLSVINICQRLSISVPHNKSAWDFLHGPRRWKATVGDSSSVSFQWLAPNAGHPRRTGDFAIPPTLSDKNRDDQKHKDDQSRASPFTFIHKTRALVGGNASASVDALCVVASRPSRSARWRCEARRGGCQACRGPRDCLCQLTRHARMSAPGTTRKSQCRTNVAECGHHHPFGARCPKVGGTVRDRGQLGFPVSGVVLSTTTINIDSPNRHSGTPNPIERRWLTPTRSLAATNASSR